GVVVAIGQRHPGRRFAVVHHVRHEVKVVELHAAVSWGSSDARTARARSGTTKGRRLAKGVTSCFSDTLLAEAECRDGVSDRLGLLQMWHVSRVRARDEVRAGDGLRPP